MTAPTIDLNRFRGDEQPLPPEVEAQVEDLFNYSQWDAKQVADGREVRIALADAFKALLAYVPPCPDRSAALRKLREARMDANSAISHRGKY